MSVMTSLGLEPDGAAMHCVRTRFPHWAAADDRLNRATTFDDFERWTRTAPPGELAEATRALAELAAESGGDDLDAAAALARVLVGGATRLAIDITRHIHITFPDQRLEDGCVDHLVASALWLTIREFPYSDLRNVVGNVLARTKYRVLLELDDPGQLRRQRSSWAATRPSESLTTGQTTATIDLAPVSDPWAPSSGTTEAADEVLDVCTSAVQAHLITPECADLLLEALSLASEASGNTCRRSGGVFSTRGVTVLAREHHMSPGTVRRRLRETIATLRENRELVA